jgi:peptidoglycan/LPS O-acetylase OafA/YrhL
VSPTHVVSGYLHDPLVFAQNALYLQNVRPGSLGTGIGPAWTLCVEVGFYLALPLLAWLAFRLGRRASTRAGRRRAVLVPILVLLLVAFFGKALAAFVVTGPDKSAGWDADWHSVLQRSFLVHADKLAYGMVIAVLRVDWEDGLLRLPRWWRKAAFATILVLGAVATKFTVSDYWWRGELSNYAYDVLVTIACALFLALVVLPPSERHARRPVLIRVLESPPIVAVGLASYSVYLWHEPVLRWLHDRDLLVSGAAGFWLNLAFAGAIVGVLSTLTYRLVEVPALRRKRSMRPAADREPEGEPEREEERPVPAYQLQAAP